MYIAFEKDPNRDGKRVVIVFILCLVFFAVAFKCSGQVYKDEDITKILGKTDSVSRLELLTAKKFHKKLNEYRKQNNVHPLKWNDTLYIVAINHTKWMTTNKTGLTHVQRDMTYDFTGVFPTDRATYVLDKKLFLVGENITYIGIFGKTIEEISEAAAMSAFNSWKYDKPHNDNMLNKMYVFHAVAFNYKGLYCSSELAVKSFVEK